MQLQSKQKQGSCDRIRYAYFGYLQIFKFWKKDTYRLGLASIIENSEALGKV